MYQHNAQGKWAFKMRYHSIDLNIWKFPNRPRPPLTQVGYSFGQLTGVENNCPTFFGVELQSNPFLQVSIYKK